MKPISKNYTIGLLSAMPEELGHTIDKLDKVIKKSYGNLEIFLGNLPLSKSENINIKIITAWSGWGKVNSTYAATRLVCEAEKQNLKLDLLFLQELQEQLLLNFINGILLLQSPYFNTTWMLGLSLKNMLFRD